MSVKTDLVLIPGLLCTDALYEPVIGELEKLAKCRIADHRRHDSMREIARAILEEAPDQFALCGLSMGGYIAFEIMRQAPERVTRLSLLDTMARADTPERMAGRTAAVAQANVEGIEAVSAALLPKWIHKDRLLDEDLTTRVTKMATDTGVDAFARQQTAIATRIDSRPTLKTITVPTLVLVGREDEVTPVSDAEEIASGIPGSRFAIIEKSGHLTTMERPEEVTAELRKWLQG